MRKSELAGDGSRVPTNSEVKEFAYKFYQFINCGVDSTVVKEHITLMQTASSYKKFAETCEVLLMN